MLLILRVVVVADLYILSMPLAETTAEPTIRVSRGWTGRFTLLWFGFWMAWLVPVQLVLPNQFAALDAAHKVRDFGIANGAACWPFRWSRSARSGPGSG
jgi:hypothetical protein